MHPKSQNAESMAFRDILKCITMIEISKKKNKLVRELLAICQTLITTGNTDEICQQRIKDNELTYERLTKLFSMLLIRPLFSFLFTTCN